MIHNKGSLRANGNNNSPAAADFLPKFTNPGPTRGQFENQCLSSLIVIIKLMILKLKLIPS